MADSDAPKPEPPPRDPLRTTLQTLHIWQIQAVRDALVVLAAIALIWVGYAMRAVTVPLLIALLLAYLFDPLVAWMTRNNRMSRSFAAGTIISVLGIVLIATVLFVVPVMTRQVNQLVDDVRSGETRAQIERAQSFVARKLPGSVATPIEDLLELVIEPLPGESVGEEEGALRLRPSQGEELRSGQADTDTDTDTDADPDADAGGDTARELAELATMPMTEAYIEERVAALVDQRLRELGGGSAEAAPAETNWFGLAAGTVRTLADVIGAGVAVVLLLVLIPFYSFFFSVWYPSVTAFGRELIPRRHRARTLELLEHMDHVVAGFVRGRIVISLIMGVLFGIGWMICGVPYALPLGLVIGVFSAVPYLGGVGLPIAVGLALAKWFGIDDESLRPAMWTVFAWPTLVFVIVQIIEGYLLTPMIAGKATNLDPVTILVAVLAGGSVLGVYGMLLAIPVTACGKILILEVLMPKVRAWVRGEIADPLPIDRD